MKANVGRDMAEDGIWNLVLLECLTLGGLLELEEELSDTGEYFDLARGLTVSHPSSSASLLLVLPPGVELLEFLASALVPGLMFLVRSSTDLGALRPFTVSAQLRLDPEELDGYSVLS